MRELRDLRVLIGVFEIRGEKELVPQPKTNAWTESPGSAVQGFR
jgi:hypothetical protein